MLFFIISALINAVTSISLGIFVYFQNPQRKLNRHFGLFAISVAVWSMGYFGWQVARDAETAMTWLRILMAGAVFIPIFYFHFVVIFVGLQQRLRTILLGGYVFAFIFTPFTIFTEHIVRGVSPKLWFPFWPEPGVLFHVFLLTFFAYATYSWYLLIQAVRSAINHNKKNQILYVFWGTFIGFLGGSTNYFLWYNIAIPPLGNWLVAIYVVMIALAILKTQLFDIRVFLTQMLVGVISVLLFINFILSQTVFEYIWKGGLLMAFLIAGYLLIRSVLSEIRQREELQRAYVKLKELDIAKSEFISIASHQLRTPLTAIKGYISMLLEKSYGEIPEKVQKPLQNVSLSNERLIKLVNDLLSISKIEAGRTEMKFEPCSMEELVNSVIEELKNVAKEKELYLKFEKPQKPLPQITIDREKIRQVILNLIDNAIRYTEKGGVTIKAKAKDSKYQIQVSDTGAGLTRYELSKMFESFSRGAAGTRLYTEGVGLGLYIAKKFVEMHQGRIWAESKGKEKGSNFYLELPIK